MKVLLFSFFKRRMLICLYLQGIVTHWTLFDTSRVQPVQWYCNLNAVTSPKILLRPKVGILQGLCQKPGRRHKANKAISKRNDGAFQLVYKSTQLYFKFQNFPSPLFGSHSVRAVQTCINFDQDLANFISLALWQNYLQVYQMQWGNKLII